MDFTGSKAKVGGKTSPSSGESPTAPQVAPSVQSLPPTPPSDPSFVSPLVERLSPYANITDEQLDQIHISSLVDMVLNTRDPEQRLKAIHDLGEYRGKYAEATAKAQAQYGPKLGANGGVNVQAIIADEKVSKRLSEGLLKLLQKDPQ